METHNVPDGFLFTFYDPEDKAYKLLRYDQGTYTEIASIRVDPTKKHTISLSNTRGFPELHVAEVDSDEGDFFICEVKNEEDTE